MARCSIIVASLALAIIGSAAAQSTQNEEPAHSERYERGVETVEKIVGATGVQAFLDNFKEISPELAKLTLEFAYGDVVSRPELNLMSRELATIAALTTLGSYPSLLKVHINGALRVGCKPEEIVEVILQIVGLRRFPCKHYGDECRKRGLPRKGHFTSDGMIHTPPRGKNNIDPLARAEDAAGASEVMVPPTRNFQIAASVHHAGARAWIYDPLVIRALISPIE